MPSSLFTFAFPLGEAGMLRLKAEHAGWGPHILHPEFSLLRVENSDRPQRGGESIRELQP